MLSSFIIDNNLIINIYKGNGAGCGISISFDELSNKVISELIEQLKEINEINTVQKLQQDI